MASSSIIYLILVILAVLLVDVFCDDVASNTRQTNPRQQSSQNSDQKSSQALPNPQSTTPWPTLGQRRRVTPSPSAHNNRQPSRPSTTPSPKKWIQQNNIWIRNEQASYAGGNPVQNNRNSLSASTSARPPLNRGDTYTVLKPQVPNNNDKQEALLRGLGVNEQNSNPKPSSTTKTPATTSKPMSYAGAVGPKNPTSSPAPSSPKKVNIHSTGPVQDKIEDSEGGQTGDAVTSDSDVSDDELREFSENILRKDSNNVMKHVTLNLQGMTTSRSSNDEAPLPLLKIDQAAYKVPSVEKIVLLYNNYFLDAGQNEVYTGQERIEENNLLDAVLATPVMQFARSFLVQKGKIGKDPKEFKDLLRQIWFNMYSRGQGRIGSSGFEHVFTAEIKNNQVSGLHNWLYFNEEEIQKRANYLGYMKKLDLGEKGAILKYHFTFHDIDKPVGSMFVGTSPELEMALYSTCFVLRADRVCPLKMNGNRFVIRTYTFRYRGKNMIGSAFPEI